jgi:hypothetical protein
MPGRLDQRSRWPTWCWLLVAGACGGAEQVEETRAEGGGSVASETGSPDAKDPQWAEAGCGPVCPAKDDAAVTVVEGGIARCPSTPPLPNGTDCLGWVAGARCRFPLGDIVAAEGECTCAAKTKTWSCSNPAQCGASACSTGQVCVTRSGGPAPDPDAAPITPVGHCVDWPASCSGPRDCSCTQLCGSQQGSGTECFSNADGSFQCAFP